jgi:hypothetical protein
LVNIVLATTSSNYANWRDLMMMALTRYSLTDHILFDDAFPNDPTWTRMDVVVLCWLNNTLTPNLQEVARERGRPTRHLWLTLENQFLSNRETRTLHLDAAFRNFVQSDLSVTEYCRKFKGMADTLADLGSPVDDRILVLNILRYLIQRFEHLGTIIQHSSPFPNILKVHDDLLLKEIHLDTAGPSAAPTALYTNTAPLPLSRGCPRRLVRPTTTTGTRTITVAMVVMAAATATRLAVAVAAVVVTLATPLRPPLDPPAPTV